VASRADRVTSIRRDLTVLRLEQDLSLRFPERLIRPRRFVPNCVDEARIALAEQRVGQVPIDVRACQMSGFLRVCAV
jgi:hypothetical protein